jgi:peptidyl-tRNA hydrolase
VLSPFRKAQLATADEALEKSSQAVRVILTLGVAAAMNRFNQKVDGEAGQAE